jgi:NAD(P)-dependent dehydrogenase (short-subunit alcohol dehydrogenase family)
MTSDEQVRRMIGFAVHEAGELHVLVNNAGGGGHVEPHFPDARADQWRGTLDLDLGGAMLATQLALDPMRCGASPLAPPVTRALGGRQPGRCRHSCSERERLRCPHARPDSDALSRWPPSRTVRLTQAVRRWRVDFRLARSTHW